MFDVGFTEVLLIGAVALIVVGPERLPKLARTAGLWVGRARRMVADVKADIDREIKRAELSEDIQEIKQSVDTVKTDITSATRDVGESLRGGVDEIKSEVDTLADDVKAESPPAATTDVSKSSPSSTRPSEDTAATPKTPASGAQE